MQFPQTQTLEISMESGMLILAIHNPPNNYLPTLFFKELHACSELFQLPEVAAIILTGKGNVFSKGVDLQDVAANRDFSVQNLLNFGNKIFSFISRLEKPVIAAINGGCFGGGLELALACHIRLCSDKARLGLPELSIGVIPGLGGIQRLIRIVGEAKALELILLGDMISAQRALELNLVSRVYPKVEFLNKALIFVRTLLTARKEAIAETLKLTLMSRSEKEEENISKAAESFLRLTAKK